MLGILKFLIKAAIVVILLYLVMQLDYNGRKLSTYVMEALRSYKVRETVATVEKAVNIPDKPKNKTTFKKKPMSDITDKERKELEEIIE